MGCEMKRGEARTWNYMSDFELDITLQQDGESMAIPEGVPFVVTVTGACGEYRASYDGRRYINCAVNGDAIRVFCNNHLLGVGRLMVDVWLKYEDVNYPDGKDIHLVEDTGCALVRGNGNTDGSVKAELALQYAVVTAYEVAAAKGYKGTEEAFYKSLAEVTDNSTAAKEAAANAAKAAETALQAGQNATTIATEAGAEAKKTAEDAAAKAEAAASKAKEAAENANEAASNASEIAGAVSAEVTAEVKASKQVREALQTEEAQRETAENARVLSEQERRNAETKRATAFADAISATETAGENAKKTAEDAAAKADTAASKATDIYTTVRTDYESGAFKGEKGDKGDTGDKGDKGDKGTDGGYLPVYEHGGGETLLTLDCNTEHRWTEVPSLKLTFGAVSDNGVGNEIRVAFKSGDTATTVTLPAGIVWAVPFVVPTNALVEMSFTYVGGKWLGVWASFDV